MTRWKRALRTPSSERFVALRGSRAVATVDLHYLPDGKVAGLAVLDEGAGWTEEQIPDLLAAFNDDLLPGVDVSRGTLSLMVVIGEVVGQMDAGQDAVPSPAKGERARAAKVK
jgi:hypothetical protein